MTTPQFTEAQLAAARPLLVGAWLREIVAMAREQALNRHPAPIRPLGKPEMIRRMAG